MTSTRRFATALSLAMRHRQWQVDAQLPDLMRDLDAERAAQAARDDAQSALADTHAARAAMLARNHFDAAALSRHATHGALAQEQLAHAKAEAERAQRDADAQRARIQELVAERDALEQKLERTRESARALAGRRASRELDELWLLRTGTSDTRKETRHED